MTMTKKSQYDLVVIGGGASGFAAAYEASQAGIRTLIVEKGHKIGGSGNYIEGIFAVDSYLQKQRNVKLTKSQALKEELTYSHYKADAASWKKYIDESADVVQWLHDLGVEYLDVKPLGDGFQTWHLFKGLGKQVINQVLAPKAEAAGVEIVTDTSAKKLNLDNNGNITSVTLANSTNETTTVNTNTVILATGGYLNNKQLIANETQYDANQLIPVNAGTNTGDGLQLAWQTGAQKYALGTAMLFGGYVKDPTQPTYVYRYSELNGAATQQPLLWVNEVGNRFVNEAVVDNFAFAGNALTTQNKVFSIMDQKTVDGLTHKQLLKPMGTWDYTAPNLPHLQSEIDQAVSQKLPFIHKADSIEKLAQELGLTRLVDTVDHYNQLADQQVDTDYQKDAQYLKKVEDGPFYAFELGYSAFCTMGGLKVDLDNRVLNTDGTEIPGLYAAGNDAAGVLIGDTYGPNMPGTEGGYSFYSGRNAARHVKTYLSTSLSRQ